MTQVVRNFVLTSLAAPITAADTSLQLATGGGAFFDIPAGDWCYVTINTNTTAEIVKYTSTGSVLSDTIVVERGQDNTFAQDFPAASCVSEGWNVAQIQGLIDQSIADTPNENNTIVVSTPPIAAPAPGIFYAIMGGGNPSLYTQGLFWYWDADTTAWVQITINGVQLTSVNPPVAAPPAGIIWAVHLSSGSLFYWTSAVWVRIAGGSGGGSGAFEIYSERGSNSPSGVNYTVGSYAFSVLAQTNFPIVPEIVYKANIGASFIVSVPTSGPNAYRLLFHNPCYVQFQASVNGFATDPTKPLNAQLLITSTFSAQQAVGQDVYKPADSTDADMYLSVATVPMIVNPGDAWDANIIVNGGTPTTSDFTITQLRFAAVILVLTS